MTGEDGGGWYGTLNWHPSSTREEKKKKTHAKYH